MPAVGHINRINLSIIIGYNNSINITMLSYMDDGE